MWDKKPKLRLDQILLDEELVTEEQISEILKLQKEQGGKLGSQLLLKGYINEENLINALSRQFECKGVVLSDFNIPASVYGMVPKNLATARKIIPFEYESNTTTLKIACENPTDRGLKSELEFLTNGKKIELYLAVELAINAAIARHYMGVDTSDENNLLLKIPMDAYHNDPEIDSKPDKPPEEKPPARVSPTSGSVLLVSDDRGSRPVFKAMLEQDAYEVKTTDSADIAIEMLCEEPFSAVFIKESVPGDYIDLVDRIRKISPKTEVRFFDKTSSFFMGDKQMMTETRLMVKNLKLFTSLLSTKEKMTDNHNGMVGTYVEKLCFKLGLPLKERLPIINAAYVHDLAKFFYKIDDRKEYKKTIDMTIKLLESLNYSPVIVQMLKNMYADLNKKYTMRLPIEVLGGNIITIVDQFCDHLATSDRLTLDKFDKIRNEVIEQEGKLFLPEVVKVFLESIEEEIMQIHSDEFAVQTIIFGERSNKTRIIEKRLRKEGFCTILADNTKSFVELYKRNVPDLMILIPKGGMPKIIKTIDRLPQEGIDVTKIPTFLLVDNNLINDLTSVLEKGIEDIIAIDCNLDLLIIKLRKIYQQACERNTQQEEPPEESTGSTMGRLADLNLVDLLYAMGPGRRSVKITITPESDQNRQLVLYLNKGQIVYAQLDEFEGAEAVCEAMTWDEGQWIVQPIGDENMPDTNNDWSNEEILMEGCRLMDERNRDDEPVES